MSTITSETFELYFLVPTLRVEMHTRTELIECSHSGE